MSDHVETQCPMCGAEVTLRLVLTLNHAGPTLSATPRYVSDHACPLQRSPS